MKNSKLKKELSELEKLNEEVELKRRELLSAQFKAQEEADKIKRGHTRVVFLLFGDVFSQDIQLPTEYLMDFRVPLPLRIEAFAYEEMDVAKIPQRKYFTFRRNGLVYSRRLRRIITRDDFMGHDEDNNCQVMEIDLSASSL